MCCKDGDGLGNYQQGMTNSLRAYRRSGIMGMKVNISGEYSGRRARLRRCGTTSMDTVVEEMRTTTEEMWDDRDDKMGWKNGDGLGVY